jgi:CDP-glucose 4,6-dehydratase
VGERRAAVEDMVMAPARPDVSFWRGRRVLLTGHTGFKGAWAALWLAELGAEVHGFALPPDTNPSLWEELDGSPLASETLADLEDEEALEETVRRARPQVVLHMAAQTLVRRGIADPVRTVATNTLGTARLLAALSGADGLEAVLLVTTDKVYANAGRRNFIEADRLGGCDPYSASKAAAELVAHSFAVTYFDPVGVGVGTARAGNVIGGGDWAEDRLVPDVWRATRAGEPARLRAPEAVRPWQHVLEPLAGYFLYAQALQGDREAPRALNFGPAAGASLSAGDVAARVGTALGSTAEWEPDDRAHPEERAFLSIDSTLARETIGWAPRLDPEEAVEWTAAWYRDHSEGRSARALCLEQIRRYEALP